MGSLDRLTASFIRQDFYELRDPGDLASAEFLNGSLEWSGLELRSRAIVGSATVSWVVDIRHGLYLREGFLSNLDSYLRLVNAIQTSLNDWLESGRPTLLYSLAQSCMDTWESYTSPEEPSEASVPSYAVVVSALVLLALVYHYLTGNVDRGGSRAYSRSSLDFRDIYVAIVLFLGAYVWIKFREVAKGWIRRELRGKQGGTKVVFDARLKPHVCDGNGRRRKVPRLDLGRFDTEQEARNKYLIAAFYYDIAGGRLDDWFPIPPMSEEERSLTGEEFRAWVLVQAKKVYEDFKKGAERLAALEQELSASVQEPSEACEGQATQERVEGNVDPCGTSLLNSAEPQQPVLASEAENSAMGMPMIGDNHALECASHSFDGMNEGPALPNGHSLSSQAGYAPPNIESGMSLNGSDRLHLLPARLGTFQQQNSDHQQQIQEFGAQILQLRGSDQFFLLQTRLDTFQQQISEQIEEFRAQILQLQHRRQIPQQQHLQESRIQNPQWSYQSYLQGQQLQDVNRGVPSFEMEMESYLRDQPLQDVNQGVPSSEMEMEQSMQEPNYSGLMAPPPGGGEFQEGFSESDGYTYVNE